MFDFTLDCINKSFKITKILLKKTYKIWFEIGVKVHFTLILVLVLVKADLLTKKRDGK